MEYATTLFAALSDPIRLRSLALIAKQGEVCVCELVHALQAAQPKISKHLAILRDAGLVRDRRDAQWVHYSLSPDLPPWARDVVAAAIAGGSATPIHAEDLARLGTMPARPAKGERHA
ncbi:MAG TPA: metalloregulator ArsR/SmtB family transcription factor [Candidatus Omnitrophota bacterium]|nr:metalloregulator ArsR/SmtB family transcription factor [Candidatus Omnitrophota bacterium]